MHLEEKMEADQRMMISSWARRRSRPRWLIWYSSLMALLQSCTIARTANCVMLLRLTRRRLSSTLRLRAYRRHSQSHQKPLCLLLALMRQSRGSKRRRNVRRLKIKVEADHQNNTVFASALLNLRSQRKRKCALTSYNAKQDLVMLSF